MYECVVYVSVSGIEKLFPSAIFRLKCLYIAASNDVYTGKIKDSVEHVQEQKVEKLTSKKEPREWEWVRMKISVRCMWIKQNHTPQPKPLYKLFDCNAPPMSLCIHFILVLGIFILLANICCFTVGLLVLTSWCLIRRLLDTYTHCAVPNVHHIHIHRQTNAHIQTHSYYVVHTLHL